MRRKLWCKCSVIELRQSVGLKRKYTFRKMTLISEQNSVARNEGTADMAFNSLLVSPYKNLHAD